MRTQKLQSKFYGPFEIVDKIGKVAYKLNLPSGSSIHMVFHVSQLKRKLGSMGTATVGMPLVGSEGRTRVEPLAILDRSLVKRNNQASEVEVLIKWSNLNDEDATWEDYNQLV
jgi:Chromo (CHRromatin Organisation MOdifier) domain